MEFVLIVIILLLFVWLRNSLSTDIRALTREINTLREVFHKELIHRDRPEEKYSADKFQESRDTRGPIIVPEEKITPPAEVFHPVKEAPVDFNIEPEVVEEIKPKPPVQKTVFTPSPKQPLFFERHPDLEKFIGENLINKIGIAILVLGISFFVKYAIDKDWINEIGRVGIGIFSGGLLIGIAHRMRKSFSAFSSVLIGGGLSVMYFTIAIAFHTYHIFDQSAAFGIMVVITAFAVTLSLLYNRIELSVLALIGGFSTPFIVSTGEGNYIVLFTYLLILNCGMLVVAYRKKWNLVNILSYAFTIFIYGGWLVNKCLDQEAAPYAGALIFGTSFYVIFFLMNIIYNIKNKTEFHVPEISILISNTFLYYAASMAILHYYANEYQGLFTAMMGIFNFAFAFIFYKNNKIDKKFIFLLIGLVLTFLSLAAPVQLEGNYITMFWSMEAVLLLWFSQKSGIKLVKYTSVFVTVLMLFSLFIDWQNLYLFPHEPFMQPFLNKVFITSVIALLSLVATRKLLSKEDNGQIHFGSFKLDQYKNAVSASGVVVLYLTFLYEMNYQLIHAGLDINSRNICFGIYNLSFLSVGYYLLRNKLTRTLSIIFFIGSILCLLFHFTIYDPAVISVRNNFLRLQTEGLFFFLHLPLAILFAIVIYISNQSAKILFKGKNDITWIKCITVFLIVYICSTELNHIVTWISYSPGRIISQIFKQISKAGYSVLWGIISLILMRQGMKWKDRILRLISLSLFFITILKLFLWDIVGISDSGKIIAFISLGVLLLVVSFMYQRLKKLILENEKTELNKIKPDDNELDKI